MKRIMMIIGAFLAGIFIFVLSFSNEKANEPNILYQVYLDGDLLGTISSKNSLEDYINNQADTIRDNVKNYDEKLTIIKDTEELIFSVTEDKIKDDFASFQNMGKSDKVNYILGKKEELSVSDLKEKSLNSYLDNNLDKLTEEEIKEMQEYYDTNKIYLSSDNIYTPNGIDMKRVLTYENDITSTEEMYEKIISKKNCTIPGYKFTITDSENKEKIVYVTDKDIFKNSIDILVEIFVGEKEYQNYKNDSQTEIETTGEKIQNVYVQEAITYKAVNIPTDEIIYTDTSELSKFLLYGDDYQEKVVTVNSGDSISSVAYNNEISVDEFLISNPEYTNENNLLYAGKQVKIAKVSPQINIVEEKYSVSDIESNYKTVEVYDETMNQGAQFVSKEGEKGIERVSQNVKSVNGQIAYVEPVSKQTIKAAIDKEITVGTKVTPNIGSTSSWGWPTNSGYTISSYYGYRIAIFGGGNFHSGLDIAGTGYGSPIYASNNGVIETIKYDNSYGYHIMINHNNGYYSLYAHMSSFAKGLKKGSVVERGQVIGYVGSSGWSTGPHLHYEIRTCSKFSCVTNPLSYY